MNNNIGMNNRIQNLFEKKTKNILSIYFTAGYPKLESTVDIIENLSFSGVDLIEIGIPFSDPVADGPVIQNSSSIALNSGMTLKKLFSQIKNIRKITDIPLILMGYFNPIFKFGVEDFCKNASEIGIDGVIIPDLPFDVYLSDYKPVFNDNNILNIFLVTPQTTDERINKIVQFSEGFIYLVSSSSTTGNKNINEDFLKIYSQKFDRYNKKINKLIGFGIKDNQSFTTACRYANGAIIGTAFIKAISKNTDKETIKNFVDLVKSEGN